MAASGCVDILLELATTAFLSAADSILVDVGMQKYDEWFGQHALDNFYENAKSNADDIEQTLMDRSKERQRLVKPPMANNRTRFASSLDEDDVVNGSTIVKHIDGSHMKTMRANKMQTSLQGALPVAVPKLALPITSGVRSSHDLRALTQRMGMVTNSVNSASSLLSNVDKPAFMMEMTGKGSLDARSQLAELAGHLGESYVADHVWSLVALQREEKLQMLAQSSSGEWNSSKCEEKQELGQSTKETANTEHDVEKTSDARLLSNDVVHKKLNDKSQPSNVLNNLSADSKCYSWDAVRDVCQHHGFCSALRNLSSHYFGMTIAAVQVDQERIASAMAMADAAGVDLSKTPAARPFDGSGRGVNSEHSALKEIAQCRAVLSFFETGLKLLKVEAAAYTSGIASTGVMQAFPVTELGRSVWWLIHPVDGLVYESMKVLDGIYMDHIVMHSTPSNVLETAKALLSFGPTSSSPLLQHDICRLANTFYSSPGCLSLAQRHIVAHISYHYVAFLRLYTAKTDSFVASSSYEQVMKQCRMHAESMLCVATATGSGGVPSQSECDESVSLAECLYGPNGTAISIKEQGDYFVDKGVKGKNPFQKKSGHPTAMNEGGYLDSGREMPSAAVASDTTCSVLNGTWDREKQVAAHKICVAAALEKFEDLGIVNFLTREMGGEFERMDLVTRTKAANIVSSTLFDMQTSQTTSTAEDANTGPALKIPPSISQGTDAGNSTVVVDRDNDDESANDNDSLNSSGWSGDLLDASDSFAESEENTMAIMMARASANVDLAVKVVPLSTTSSRRCALVDVFAEVMALRMLSGSCSTSKNGSFIGKCSGILGDKEECSSPVAVEMIEYGVTPEGYCIVMERCARSLRDWRAMIPESIVDADLGGHLKRCLALFQDIVSKVTILHSMGVTHYDLKCDNILVVSDSFSGTPMAAESVKLLPRLRLADFGESYVTPGYHADSTRSKWDRGTECIKSPEMLTISVITDADHPDHDRRKNTGTSSASDIWSLGCLFYLWDQIIFCGQGDITEKFKVLFLGKKVKSVESVATCNSTVAGMLARRRMDEVEAIGGKDLLVYDGSKQGYRLLVATALQWLQMGRGMSPLAAVCTLEDKIM
eukprot:g2305.t1